ncbi:multi-sensor hybrid histidine kinase [Acidisarcina polymorpha]|uniref:Sensory/regulatory protein RpfC n=1 Tax=Acidisarcina polymorpha TaxID=2211140 RepID=A0A2Z5FX03_9BACT|nr:multi-sensor hybrid histidine kinase [Acidisarcina polymorpha]
MVTYYDVSNHSLRPAFFVTDSTGSIFVGLSTIPALPFKAGQLVEVVGRSDPGGFAPSVRQAAVRVIGDAGLPANAPSVSASQLLTGEEDCRWVQIEGVVYSVKEQGESIVLRVGLSDGIITATTIKEAGVNYDSLVDAKIKIRGNAATLFNDRGQMTGALIHFPSLGTVDVVAPSPANPFLLPTSPVGSLMRFTSGDDFRHRVHIRGTVTLFWPGRLLCLQDSFHGVCAQTEQTTPLVPGDVADVAGFPMIGDFSPTLSHATYHLATSGEALPATRINADQALQGDHDAELVQIEGHLIGEDKAANQPTILLSSGKSVFTAVLPIQPGTQKHVIWQEGSELRVTGICSAQSDQERVALHQGYSKPQTFRMILRSPADVVVLRRTSWWNASHTLRVLALALGITLCVLCWVIVLRSRVRQQTLLIHLQLEEADALKRAAEFANSSKSEFLANMSHEIRTPLNGVIGMTDLMLESELNAHQRDYLEVVKISADSLLAVINGILDFSKIEAGKIELEAIEFSLRDCVEEALMSQSLRAGQKGLELVCDIASDVPAMVKGDPGRLRQIILNLVSNAIKFTELGEVSVRVEVEREEAGSWMVRFSVADTGIGVSAEKQSSIFSPFTQEDSSTTRKYGGTGLGLTISSRLVEMMRGRIWVESVLGQGSQFCFTSQFEVVDKRRDSEIVLPDTGALRGMRVLIVDDNRTNRRILGATLQTRVALTTCVEGGEQALVELGLHVESGEPYQIVITDMDMPGMDGLALIEEMRRRPGMSLTPAVLLSSGGVRGDAERCRKLGVLSYLYKPARRSELLAAIQAAAEGTRSPVLPQAGTAFHAIPARVNSLRILLAEDNRVNQAVASGFLEKLGHVAIIAANGREALALLESETFDLVLMDVQMPEMDGIAATKQIRENEAFNEVHLPIIAMTAHAMKGDRERCLAAGMDDYISKPINSAALEAALLRAAPGAKDTLFRDAAAGLQARSSSVSARPVDRAYVLEKLGGDEQLCREVIDMFLEEAPVELAELGKALTRGDSQTVEWLAHSFKGKLGYLGGEELSRMAQRLEEAGRNSDLEAATGVFAGFEAELSRLLLSMQSMGSEMNVPPVDAVRGEAR